jgi:CheY-like chemotaxis protein
MPRTVLVVDDDPLVLEVVAEMLQDLGFEVITAGGGAGALDELRRNQLIELIITDINMPGMDGHELAHQAARIRPTLQIIQLSGRERRRDGLPLIKKPFSAEELADEIRRLRRPIV